MTGKIVMSFGEFGAGKDGVPNPMHFGNMAWKPELTLVLPLRGAWQGRALVPAALPAALGFLASGLLNTLIDAPRFLALLLLLLWLATLRQPPDPQGCSAGEPVRSP